MKGIFNKLLKSLTKRQLKKLNVLIEARQPDCYHGSSSWKKWNSKHFKKIDLYLPVSDDKELSKLDVEVMLSKLIGTVNFPGKTTRDKGVRMWFNFGDFEYTVTLEKGSKVHIRSDVSLY